MEHLVKYGRTYHLPFSEGSTSDDKFLKDFSLLEGKEIVVSIKMDGENTTAYSDNYTHARSRDSVSHPSRDWFKAFWAERFYNLPKGWRVCGENLYARHSISYDNLESFFYCFNIWDENNTCLSIDETLAWCDLLEMKHVDIIYRGMFDLSHLERLYKEMDKEVNEGFVIRLTDSFHYDDFYGALGKAVRPNHVTTDQHWMHSAMVLNKLKNPSKLDGKSLEQIKNLLVGKSHEEALKIVESDRGKFNLRVMKKAGTSYFGTSNFDMKRINIELDINNIVVNVTGLG